MPNNFLIIVGKFFTLELIARDCLYIKIGAFERCYNRDGLPSH